MCSYSIILENMASTLKVKSVIVFHILAKYPDQNGFWGTIFSQDPIFLQFWTGNWFTDFCEGVSSWRHTSQALGLLVLYLVSMFRRDSKLNIGTKINIIQGFIAKIRRWGLPFVKYVSVRGLSHKYFDKNNNIVSKRW